MCGVVDSAERGQQRTHAAPVARVYARVAHRRGVRHARQRGARRRLAAAVVLRVPLRLAARLAGRLRRAIVVRGAARRRLRLGYRRQQLTAQRRDVFVAVVAERVQLRKLLAQRAQRAAHRSGVARHGAARGMRCGAACA